MKQLLFFGFIFSALAAGFTDLHGQTCCAPTTQGGCEAYFVSTPGGGVSCP